MAMRERCGRVGLWEGVGGSALVPRAGGALPSHTPHAVDTSCASRAQGGASLCRRLERWPAVRARTKLNNTESVVTERSVR